MPSKQQRVFICCSSYPPELGGAPGRIHNLGQLLKSAGYAVTVFTSLPNYPRGRIFQGYRRKFFFREIVDGIEVRRLWLMPSNSSGLFARGASLITQCIGLLAGAARSIIFNRADVVYISSPPLITACLYAALARFGRKKVLVNISDIWPLTAAELGVLKDGAMMRVLRRLERGLYQRAAGITGQSEEILSHVAELAPQHTPRFLYRNLPEAAKEAALARQSVSHPPRKLVYAGVLGFAQGLLEICQSISFEDTGAELHIYGEGAERALIADFILRNSGTGIVLHDPVPPDKMQVILSQYDGMLIPLRNSIRGAVPSKLYTAIGAGLPVVYCAGGEGAELVRQNTLGWTSSPGDIAGLKNNLIDFSKTDDSALREMNDAILKRGWQIFDKSKQDRDFLMFLEALIAK